MKKDRLEEVEKIYQAVIELPESERAGTLGRECGDDDDLRREVESLLLYDKAEVSFIDSPPALLAAEVLGDEEGQEYDPGHSISHYTIERLLGEGGMGKVYLAEDTRLRRKVALKIFPTSIASDGERLMRFEREAQAASALNHPNILTVYEFGQDAGVHYIATEFVDGVTLRTRLAASRTRVADGLDISIQVASALAAAHEAGITHRDVKPENIMIRRDGYAKVLDFGLAKLVQAGGATTNSGSEDPTIALHRTKPGAVMGTAAYMSPEQARGLQVDARTDIWSLGVVLYEMLAGTRPFDGETHADVIVSVLRNEPLPLSEYVADLPPEIDWIVNKSLSKNIEARYQTAAELRADLEKIKRKLELDDSISRSARLFSGKAEPGGTELKKVAGVNGAATDYDAPRPTSGGRTAAEDGARGHYRSFQRVVTEVKTHKAWSAATLVLVAIVAGIAGYFGISAVRGNVIDSIAVLPFENISGDANLNYASDGMSQALIDRLAQLPQLKVIARNSSFKFRGANIDVKTAASQLGARAVVTGSVQQIGDDIVVRVDLVDATEDRQLGGAEYRRKATEIESLRNEIAKATAEQLNVKLTETQTERLVERNTENSEAYRYYLNGLVALDGTPEGHERALPFFEKAIELDPGFALPYAESAWVYYLKALSDDDPAKVMPKVKTAVEKALVLDSQLAKAHVMRAVVHEYELNWQAAEQEYLHAIELSPNLDFARNNYAFFLSALDRQDEALAQLEEQRVRDPLNMRFLLLMKAIVLVQARRYDDALETYREAQAVEPSNEIPRFALGYAYAGKGLNNEAIEYYKQAIAKLGGEEKYSQSLVYLAATYAKMPEKRAEARAILTRLENMNEYVSPALLAAIYAELGENDKAMELLEQAFIKRDLLLRFIKTAYEYDGLRGDPRFVDLMRRMGLVQ